MFGSYFKFGFRVFGVSPEHSTKTERLNAETEHELRTENSGSVNAGVSVGSGV
jgi:hypothetical protein